MVLRGFWLVLSGSLYFWLVLGSNLRCFWVVVLGRASAKQQNCKLYIVSSHEMAHQNTSSTCSTSSWNPLWPPLVYEDSRTVVVRYQSQQHMASCRLCEHDASQLCSAITPLRVRLTRLDGRRSSRRELHSPPCQPLINRSRRT